MKNNKEIEPGIYELENGKLVFKRPGYDMRHLKDLKEFIITDNVPHKNKRFKPHGRILRVLTLNSIMDEKTQKLNGWASEIANSIYEELGITEV